MADIGFASSGSVSPVILCALCRCEANVCMYD